MDLEDFLQNRRGRFHERLPRPRKASTKGLQPPKGFHAPAAGSGWAYIPAHPHVSTSKCSVPKCTSGTNIWRKTLRGFSGGFDFSEVLKSSQKFLGLLRSFFYSYIQLRKTAQKFLKLLRALRGQTHHWSPAAPFSNTTTVEGQKVAR